MKQDLRQNLLLLLITPLVFSLGLIIAIFQGLSVLCEFIADKLMDIIGL